MDTRFQTCIARGRLYGLVTLTGNRNLLPLAFAWAPSENTYYTDKLLGLLKENVRLIQSCHSDESKALIKSIESHKITSLLCTWHMPKHCPNKEVFKSLVKSQTSSEYFTKKQDIIDKNLELLDYLNENDRWKKISRFECNAPRDQNIASTTAESLNAMIVRLDLKNKEPLDVLISIYDIGYFCLKDMCLQNDDLVNSANDYLNYALTVAKHLTVKRNPIYDTKYEVTKEGDEDSKCTVIIAKLGKPSCSCRFFEDCGMPCVHILAAAIQSNIDWSDWVHPRFYTSLYKKHFENLIYPNFDGIIKTTNDLPRNCSSLKQRQKRIPTPGEKSSSKKKKKYIKNSK